MMENFNLPYFLLRSIEKSPDKVYMQFKDERITYQELYHRIGKGVAGFRELGIQKGDKVCMMMNNDPHYVDIWFSLSFMGAVIVPLNVHLKGEGLQYILSHSDCKLIVTDKEFVSKIQASLAFIARDVTIIVHDNNANIDDRNIIQLNRLLQINHSFFPNESIASSSINSILYTSGTTGLPKGVMLSHHAYVQSAQSFADLMVGARADDILYTALPLFHINAEAHTVLGSIHANATIALGKRFSASKFWDEIHYHGATIFNSLGSMIPILCKQPETETDSINPARVTACAATPKEFWKVFEERFAVRIVEGYGLTETTGFCVANANPIPTLSSIGKPYSYVDTKIVNEKGEEVPIGQIGEIVIRSSAPHTFMEGYYKIPDKTEESIKEGWFHTGDRGYQDENGFLYFCDRIKQCIRRRGENISSWEIETIMNHHPKVLESAAIGVPSEVGEEDVKLYVILKKDETMTYEEVLDWCQERMAYFMVPRYVQFSESFPKTATERIQKFKLKEEGIGDGWDREKTGYEITKR